MDLSAEIARHRRRVVAMAAVVVGAVALIALAADLLVGAHLILFVALTLLAAGAVLLAWRRAGPTALRLAGARPLDLDSPAGARVENLVDAVCATAGVPPPALYMVEDDAANVMALGRDPRHAALVVTSGLVAQLSVVELEGVLAQQIGRIKGHATGPATLAVTLFGYLSPGLVTRAVGPPVDVEADMGGVALTRYPPGLVSALEKVADGQGGPTAHRAVAHLWAWPPGANTSRPSVEHRIEALREL